MKIGIIGASGKSGKLITEEALSRGHEVTAIVRNPEKIVNKDVKVVKKDIFDIKTEDIKAFDVVVNAFNSPEGQEHLHVDSHRVLIDAFKGVDTRLIVVGGAGSLYVDEEKTTHLYDTPDFPDFVYPLASNMGKALEELKQTDNVNWTHLSPAAMFDPEGKRTGSYKTGNETVINNNAGESYISYADYAISLVDEIENPQHVNERFTVVGEKE
ncbi:NAD(P)-dependent oxidoreductase [Gracilibacillus sp. S3-1-1]|uniref:NAD(P)-dependent oxidoreductase n=1 Tax=Gracilibacillus pellucidus TaxID=3095368 RepID=A0ACC6M691_9BACI|nr:NAD(P)-dependent oxidoreductase [Gracilibacillus sp. S3-1-1]MDX8046411.1 NAD(P)-dependent oxidoreductase [Gracilibacillus sp. S3-1-1]